MAKRDDMSIDDILAAARGQGGGGKPAESKGEAAPESAKPKPAKPEKPAKAAPAAATGGGKKASEMSIEEMLAAARGGKGGDAPSEKPAAPKVPAKPAAAAGGKKASEMSMEEMLAAARGAKKTEAPAAEKPKPAAKAPAAKAAAPAAESPQDTGPKDTGPKDTGSVLTGHKGDKAGPMSKAEAAAKGKVEPPKARSMPTMPERPAYLAPPTPAAADRRGFFAGLAGAILGSSLAVGFSSLAVTNLLWVLGLARFMFPNILTEPPTRFKVGFPDEYGPGQVQEKYKAMFGVWIVRSEYEGQPQIYALQTVCTHLGCTPNWLEGEQKFKCPCHGSGFYKDGVNFEGPAPRPLERFAIRIADDGQIEVDKSRKFQEELGQWSDPASFVPV